MDVRTLTVGPIAENCHIVRGTEGGGVVVVDPGEEPERILAAVEAWGEQVEAIVLTHTHFDHVGAVAPLARATGAPVYCPELERHILENLEEQPRFPGMPPAESHTPEHVVAGGETLDLAGISFDVLFTPGHSPGHVAWLVRETGGDEPPVIFSGDVLFRGSVGRIDLPGGDGPTLLQTLKTLVEELEPATVVYPGHMSSTTIGEEVMSNPYLQAGVRL